MYEMLLKESRQIYGGPTHQWLLLVIIAKWKLHVERQYIHELDIIYSPLGRIAVFVLCS